MRSECEQFAIDCKTVASEDHANRNPGAANDAIRPSCNHCQSANDLDLLHHFLASTEQNGDPSLVAKAHAHMAWVFAHLGAPSARAHAELAWEYFSCHHGAAVWLWHAAVTLAWLRATAGNGEAVDEVLALGVAAWKSAGKPPFGSGALLFEFDQYPVLLGALQKYGLRLEREAGRAIDSTNRVAAAAAHCCLARYLRRGSSSRNRHARIALHFARAIDLLRGAGSTVALLSALAAAVSQAESMGETERAATLRREQAQLQATVSDGAPPARGSQIDPEIAKDWVRLDEVERRYIADVLHHTHGRITGTGGAAVILGLNPSTLSWRIDKLGLREILAEVRRTARTQSKKRKRVKD